MLERLTTNYKCVKNKSTILKFRERIQCNGMFGTSFPNKNVVNKKYMCSKHY